MFLWHIIRNLKKEVVVRTLSVPVCNDLSTEVEIANELSSLKETVANYEEELRGMKVLKQRLQLAEKENANRKKELVECKEEIKELKRE